jgi:hypothetical protein
MVKKKIYQEKNFFQTKSKAPYLKYYTVYINNYDKAMKNLEKCRQNPFFRSYLKVKKKKIFA